MSTVQRAKKNTEDKKQAIQYVDKCSGYLWFEHISPSNIELKLRGKPT